MGAGKKGVGGCDSPSRNLESFMQQAGSRGTGCKYMESQGTNLFCYRQPEDTDAGDEPLFTIAINKVMSLWW